MSEQADLFPKVSLVEALCDALDSDEKAMLCAMSHSQVRVDGHLVFPKHDRAWTQAQLSGRLATCNGRSGRLFGASRRAADDVTQVVASAASGG